MREKAFLVTLVFIVLALLATALIVPCLSGDSVVKMRERTLRQDVIVIRALIAQYTLDLHRRPQSLHDLVAGGYLKQVPTDPMSGRNDTWVMEWSNDPKMPGIVSILSGSGDR
jgi:general secretion pathway protein G